MINRGDHMNAKILMPPPKAEDIVPVRDAMQNLAKLRACWVHGHMYLLPAQSKLHYIACAKCNKSMKRDEGWTITCNGCRKQTTLESRCRVGVLINDNTRTMEAMMVSPVAECITTFSATELKKAFIEGNEVLQ